MINMTLWKKKKLFYDVKNQFTNLGLCHIDQITDYKVIKLPEVYPMYIKGYQAALAETRERFDKIRNLYTLGSLAEFIYADLQILFSKAIDLAQIISDKTFKINSIDKTNPRLDFNQTVDIKDKIVGKNHETFFDSRDWT